MGSSNTFSKALKHLKASRPSSLHEEVPTNNTQGLYRVEPMTFQETNPGVDAPDFDRDGDGSSGYTGTDTSGLFMPDGTIRVAEPPGDTSAILGPMASMWYAWGNFSTFGYIRQSDRKMVNLGRITGKLSDWDGVSDFTSYNTGFTIDQAVWFRDVEKYGGISNDPAEANYRAFYPGPPSNTPDQYGRYYCTTTGRPKNRRTGSNPPNRGPEGAGFPWGSGSNPNRRRRRGGQGGRPGGSSGNRGGYGGGGPGEGGGFGGPGGPGGEGGEGGDGPPKPPENPIDPNTGEPREPATPEELQKAAQYVQYLAQKSVNDPGSLTPAEQERLQAYSGENSVFKSTVDDAIARAQAPDAPTRRGQGGRELGDTTQRGGNTQQNARNVENNNNAIQNVNQFFDDHGDTINNVLTVADIALATASIVGILVPEPATSAAGVAGLASLAGKLRGAANIVKGVQKGKGLARGLRGVQVGATGLKKGGYEALKGGKNLHRGSKGLLSPGGKGVYSAPKVGQVGPGGLKPGSGAGRYVKSGSNPLGGAQGRAGQPGGVVGSVTPGGARRIGGVEPQAVVNPQTFRKGQQLFQKVQGGAYPKSPTAARIRQQAQQAGFKPGQSNIPASQMPGLRSSGGVRSGGSSRGTTGLRSSSETGALGLRSGSGLSSLKPSRGARGRGLSSSSRSTGSSGGIAGKGSGNSFKQWYNTGRQPGENTTPFGDIRQLAARDPSKVNKNTLFGNDRLQRGQSNAAFDSGQKSGVLGRPDRAVLGRDLDPRSPDFLKKVSGARGGPGSAPTPAIRQMIERPARSIGRAGRALGKNPLAQATALNALNASPAKGQMDPQYLDKSGNIDVKKMDDLFRNNPDEFQKQLQRGMSGTPTVLPDIAPSNIPSLSDVENQKVDTLMKDLRGMKPGTTSGKSARKALLKYAEKMDNSDPRYLDVLDAITGQSGNQSNFGRPKKGVRSGVMPGKGYGIGGKSFRIGEEVEHLLEEKDNMDKVIEKLMKNPKFKKMLPKLLKHIDDEIELGLMSQMMFDEDGNFAEPPVEEPREKIKSTDVKESHAVDVIRNIKKPVVIEEKKEKIKRRPRVIGSEPRTLNTSLMKQAEVPASFKKPEERMWGKYEREQNARASQDRKNVVLDHLGNADQAWEYLLDRNAGKRSFAGYFEKDGTPRTIFTDGKVKTVTREEKVGSDTLIFFTDEEGKKGSILQSEYNELQDQAHTQQMFAEYEATVAAAKEEENDFDKIANKLELRAEKNPTNGKIQSMLSSYRALSHLRKEDKKQEAHFTSWKSTIDGKITSNFQSWVDSVGKETADAVAVTEAMTSGDMFVRTQLEPTGEEIRVPVPSDSFRYNQSDAVTTTGGVVKFGEVAPHNYDSQYWWRQTAGTNYITTTDVPGEQTVTHVTFDVDLGTGIDAPLPNHPLKVEYQMVYRDSNGNTYNAGTGTLGNITAGGKTSFELPQYHEYFEISFDLTVDGTWMRSYELDYQRRMFVGTNFYGMALTADDVEHPLSPTSMIHSILHRSGGYDDDADSSMHVFLMHTRTNGQTVYQSLNTMPSGETGGHTGADREYLYNLIRSQYAHLKDRYAQTYTINSMGLTRVSPITVWVPLDSPEAVSFMRTAPEMRGLTPAQRLKKLKEMLKSGNEYLIKMLGYQGSTATPGPNEPADYLDGADELLNDLSPEEQAEIEKNLAKLGPEYAQLAAIPAALPLLASPAGQAALALGASAVATLLIKAGIDVNNVMQASRDWDDSAANEQEAQDTEVGQMKDRQRGEAQAADKALQDAIDQYGADSEEAQEARQAKNDTLTRHKKERKSIGGKDDRGRGAEGDGMTSQGDLSSGSNATWYGGF